jgi:hypothetical protein
MEFFPFAPNPKGPFVFAPIIDGRPHTAEVVWSLFGRRWYLRLTSPEGELIVFTAIAGSPDFAEIESLRWDQLRERVILTAAAPHKLRIGSVAALIVRGCEPASFNGAFLMTVESPVALSYPMKADPGPLVRAGYWGSEVNLVAGYSRESRLVYRESARRFEVWP